MNSRNKTEKEEQLLIRWVNGHFTSNKDTPISSLTEFDNGEKLLRFLLEIFGSTEAAQAIIPTLPPPSSTSSAPAASSSALPGGKGRVASTQKFQNLEMLQRALRLATSVGVNFRFISAEDFIEHNIKMILSFITSSIVKFNALKLTTDPSAATQRSPRAAPQKAMRPKDFYDGILRGINKIISRPPYNLHINDFSTRRWGDGLGFLALIHSCCPTAFSYPEHQAAVTPHTGEYDANGNEVAYNEVCLPNLSAAFKYAQDLLDLFPLLVPEDFTAASPALLAGGSDAGDDQGVMMYLSELYSIVLQRLPPGYLYEEPQPQPQPAAPPPQEPVAPAPVSKYSDEEYERMLKELEESRSRVNELENELRSASDRQREAEDAAERAEREAREAREAREKAEKEAQEAQEAQEKAEKEAKEAKEAQEKAEKEAKEAAEKRKKRGSDDDEDSESDDDDIVDDDRDEEDEYGRTRNAMTTTHTDEHKKVLKTSEQIKRAMERLEDLAEQAQEEDDEEALEALPEELEFLLDFIAKKDKEVEDSAYLMNQLETQLTSSGDDTPLTNSEREEVDRIMKEINTEEKKVLDGIEKVIAGLLDDVAADKPVIAAELERIRSLAALGAERAGNAMKDGQQQQSRIKAVAASAATAPKNKSNAQSTGPARSTSFVKAPTSARPASVIIKPGKDSTISVNSTAPVKRGGKEADRNASVNSTAGPVVSATSSVSTGADSGSKGGSRGKKELSRSVTLPTLQNDSDPFEDESKPVMPIIIEGLNDVEQKFEEDPELKDKKGSISGAKNNANGFMEKTKKKFGKVVKIVKKANHKKEKKEKKEKEKKEKEEKEKGAATPDPKVLKEAVAPYRSAMIRAVVIFEAAAGTLDLSAGEEEVKQKRVAELKKAEEKELVEAFESSAGTYEALLEVKNRALRDMQTAMVNAQADVWEKLKAAQKEEEEGEGETKEDNE